MSPHRKTSLAAGVLYLLTFVSIPTLAMYGPVKGANYILGAGPDTGAIFGGILEMIVALAGIGTAVALFQVVKRQNEGVALGFVASRTLEAAGTFASVACLLTVVTLRQEGAGADALVTSHALVAMYDRLFLVTQSFIPAVNALLLGSLMYQSRLVFNGPVRDSNRAMGVFAGRLAGRQRFQARCHHRPLQPNCRCGQRLPGPWGGCSIEFPPPSDSTEPGFGRAPSRSLNRGARPPRVRERQLLFTSTREALLRQDGCVGRDERSDFLDDFGRPLRVRVVSSTRPARFSSRCH